MKYKRITDKRQLDGYVETHCPTCPYYKDERCGGNYGKHPHLCRNRLTDRLCELEDKICNGTLIELPCIRVLYPYRSGPLKDEPAYHVCYINKYGILCDDNFFDDKKAAEGRLKALKEEV